MRLRAMAIDKTGKWWVGRKPEDIEEYLQAYSEDSYPTHQFRLCRCECGSVEFKLAASDDEGVARRTCLKCGLAHLLCDSQEYWDEAEPEEWACVECGSHGCNVGVGFSLYDKGQDIKWLYVGTRCALCGILGCFAGWKVGSSPSLQLMDQV
jgi:hypothetical protein